MTARSAGGSWWSCSRGQATCPRRLRSVHSKSFFRTLPASISLFALRPRAPWPSHSFPSPWLSSSRATPSPCRLRYSLPRHSSRSSGRTSWRPPAPTAVSSFVRCIRTFRLGEPHNPFRRNRPLRKLGLARNRWPRGNPSLSLSRTRSPKRSLHLRSRSLRRPPLLALQRPSLRSARSWHVSNI